jgi:DNA-directed RNA polymerase specialized sigma24 family protein
MSNMAKAVLRYFDSHDQSLAEKMVDKFVERVFSRNLLSKFDPERGEIGRFLWGVMRNIALECFRERSRERNEARLYQSPRGSREPEPNVSAERNEQVERVRNWLMELPSAQRNAVARRFAALADLDSGGTIPNECVARHRGLKRLQRKAAESDIGDNTG